MEEDNINNNALKKSKHRLVKFGPVLQAKYSFIKADPTDPSKCICRLCNTSFRAEKSDIERHASNKKHLEKKAAVNPQSQKNMVKMFSKQTALENKVKYAEIKLAGFVAAHDEAFLKMDHLIQIIQKIFPDSQIANSMSLKRTKTKAIILNAVGATEKDCLTARLKEVKFSILTDDSTDISAMKTSCVMVRFYDQEVGRVCTRHWDLKQIYTDEDYEVSESGATAQVLFDQLMSTFNTKEIPAENIIGFASDTCNVMMGCHNSVATRMQLLCPGLMILKCICHSLHLCSSSACKVLPRICEDLCRLIFNYFGNSSKRQAQFRQFQAFFDLDITKVLHPSQTRWLSLNAVVKRTLEHWEALKLYFADQALNLRLQTAEMIHSSLCDPFIKAYYYFLKWVLPKIAGLNEYFQSEKTVVTFVHERMVTTYKEFLLTYMARDYVLSTAIDEIRPDDHTKYLDIRNVYLGVDVMSQLSARECQENPALIHHFRDRCRLFLVTFCKDLKEKYDFNNPVLSKMHLLSPKVALSHQEREQTPSLFTLVRLLPRCIAENEIQAVDEEWRRLPLQAESLPSDICDTSEPDQFWHKLLHYGDDSGEQRFVALPKFALTTLSLPISNADCEREFSKVNNIKTKRRNKLITPTVNGILHASQAVKKFGGCCVQYSPLPDVYKKLNNSMYEFASSKSCRENETDIFNLFSFE